MNDVLKGADCRIDQGDCIEIMAGMPSACVDMLVTSIPFPSLYAYTGDEADIGNSEDLSGEAPVHLSFFYKQVRRVVKPGRAVLIHVMDIPRLKRSGGEGLYDFGGLNARLGERAGLVFAYGWAVRKNPQAQAIRTKSRELQFAGLESDRARSRGALPDRLLKFVVPGDNAVPVVSKGEVSRNDWIEWAEHCWADIRETDTLNVREARDEEDTKHICPLQLGLIERCIRLFSNPGEVVFDPFMGIGSVAFVALGGRSPATGNGLARQRRAMGCELKPTYHRQAVKNAEKARRQFAESQRTLFDNVEGSSCR